MTVLQTIDPALEKAPLLSGTPGLGTITAFRNLPFEGAIQPCHTYGAAPAQYFVSVGTVRSHVSALMHKVGAVDRDDLIAMVERGERKQR